MYYNVVGLPMLVVLHAKCDEMCRHVGLIGALDLDLVLRDLDPESRQN